MLSDVDMEALTVQSELPLDWGACVKLLGHTRFVSRLLKLTRGALKVPDVVYTIISRRLSHRELEGASAESGGESVDGGSEHGGGSDSGEAALRSDRLSAIEQWELGWDQATLNEFRLGLATVASGETEAGARRFASGKGRHGDFADIA